jgi:hypothetical protein
MAASRSQSASARLRRRLRLGIDVGSFAHDAMAATTVGWPHAIEHLQPANARVKRRLLRRRRWARGAVLALLLARQGVRVTLLEAHQDFEREFRGDTVHPSTLQMLDDLGLYDKLLELPHATFFDFPTHYPDGSISTNAPVRVRSRHARIMDVPQARLIDTLVTAAQRYPNFTPPRGTRGGAAGGRRRRSRRPLPRR